jgi:hypothetical protein
VAAQAEEQHLQEEPSAPAYIAIDMPDDHAVEEPRVSQSMSQSIRHDPLSSFL